MIAKKLALIVAAALAGASGLGLEVLIVSLSGLSLGYGVNAAVGITCFLVGWSLGARFSGGYRGPSRTLLWLSAAGLVASAWVVPRLFVLLGAGTPSPTLVWIGSLTGLLLIAFPQGVFLPQFARAWPLTGRRDLGLLFAANLVGAALGAWQIGHVLPGQYGRFSAAAVAGTCALGAALCASWITEAASAPVGQEASEHSALEPWRAGLVLAIATGWLGTLEWLGLRLGVLWLGGMQPALTGILIASMIALSIGAWLGPLLVGRGAASLVRLAAACCLSSAWFFVAPRLLSSMPDAALSLRALCLVGPVLAPFGAVVPVLHRELRGVSSERLGRLLLWEALGALVGLPLSHVVLLPALGLNGTLACWALFASLAWVGLARPRHLASLAGAGVLATVLAVYALVLHGPLALDSPPLSNPALRVLEFDEDQHFAVAVVEDGLLGQRTLMTDGFRAAGTGHEYAYMRALGHLPLLMHEAPERVAVLAFGTGTTAGAVSLHAQVERLDVLELSAAVAAQAEWFDEVNRGVLRQGAGVELRLGDGRRTLAAEVGSYDVLTMEPLLPDSPFGVYLYTEEFYARARAALAPNGLLCQWVPPHALAPESFEAVVAAFCEAFPWSSVWVFGTQVLLLGGERAPLLRASRFPAPDSELGVDLATLGLESPAGLLARWVGSGSAWPRPERPLTDADPWIVYSERRAGLVLLSDLPSNLRSVRERAERAPLEWLVGLAGAAQQRLQGVARLRAAREAAAIEELEARGVSLPDPGFARDSRAQLAEAKRLAPGEPGIASFESERQFLFDLREGVAVLSRAADAEAAVLAIRALQRALAARPERADVHWYMAYALELLQRPEAAEARSTALELCPRIEETAAGLRVSAWRR